MISVTLLRAVCFETILSGMFERLAAETKMAVLSNR
jgi:hypothetical protein